MDIQYKDGGDISPPSSPTKKPKFKFKLNRKTIIIGGVILLLVFFVLKKLIGGSTQAQPETVVLGAAGSEYGTNGVDTAAQIQSASDVMEQQVNSTLGAFMSEIQASVNENNAMVQNAINENNSDINSFINDKFTSSLQNQADKFTTINQANTDALTSLREQMQTMQSTAIKNATEQTGVVQTKPIETVAAKSGFFQSGSFAKQSEAENVAKQVASAYGGGNVQVNNVGGRFTVTSTFESQERASKVSDRLKERNLIQIGHVSAGK